MGRCDLLEGLLQTVPPEMGFPGPPYRLRFAARTFTGSPLTAPRRGPNPSLGAARLTPLQLLDHERQLS